MKRPIRDTDHITSAKKCVFIYSCSRGYFRFGSLRFEWTPSSTVETSLLPSKFVNALQMHLNEDSHKLGQPGMSAPVSSHGHNQIYARTGSPLARSGHLERSLLTIKKCCRVNSRAYILIAIYKYFNMPIDIFFVSIRSASPSRLFAAFYLPPDSHRTRPSTFSAYSRRLGMWILKGSAIDARHKNGMLCTKKRR